MEDKAREHIASTPDRAIDGLRERSGQQPLVSLELLKGRHALRGGRSQEAQARSLVYHQPEGTLSLCILISFIGFSILK